MSTHAEQRETPIMSDTVPLADGRTVPRRCVEALQALDDRWPGATFHRARPAIVAAVLEAYESETAKRLAAECDRYGLPHNLDALLRHLEGNRALTEATKDMHLGWQRDALLAIVALCMDADANLLDAAAKVSVHDVLQAITGSGIAVEPLRAAVAKSEWWAEHAAASAPPPLHATSIETRDGTGERVLYTAHCGCGWSGQPQVATVSDRRSRHRALDAAERMAEHHAATAKRRDQ